MFRQYPNPRNYLKRKKENCWMDNGYKESAQQGKEGKLKYNRYILMSQAAGARVASAMRKDFRELCDDMPVIVSLSCSLASLHI